MEIRIASRKLQKILNSQDRMKREYGADMAKAIMMRMAVLQGAPTLAAVPVSKPERCHRLQGDRKDRFAVDLRHPFRLLFEPDHNPLPLGQDGGIDKSRVTVISILDILDYH